MYEYEIMNTTTKERSFIWGYNWDNALERLADKELNPNEWELLHADYID